MTHPTSPADETIDDAQNIDFRVYSARDHYFAMMVIKCDGRTIRVNMRRPTFDHLYEQMKKALSEDDSGTRNR
jgi:hypothetical protein